MIWNVQTQNKMKWFIHKCFLKIINISIYVNSVTVEKHVCLYILFISDNDFVKMEKKYQFYVTSIS